MAPESVFSPGHLSPGSVLCCRCPSVLRCRIRSLVDYGSLSPSGVAPKGLLHRLSSSLLHLLSLPSFCRSMVFGGLLHRLSPLSLLPRLWFSVVFVRRSRPSELNSTLGSFAVWLLRATTMYLLLLTIYL